MIQIGDEIEITGKIQGWTGLIVRIIDIRESGDIEAISDPYPDDPILLMPKEVKPYFHAKLFDYPDFCKYPYMAANARNKKATNISCRKSQEMDASRYFEFVRR